MKTRILSSLLVTLLLTGCQRAERDPQLEAIEESVSELKSAQAELKKQVDALASLVKDATEASLRASETLADLKESVEATKAAAIEREKARELRDALEQKLRLAETFRERGEYTEAYKTLKGLLDKYPDEPQSLRARAELAEWGVTEDDMKKPDEEVGKLLKSNIQRRRDARRFNAKAAALEQSGDFVAAIKAYQKIAREYSDVDEVRWVPDMLTRCDLADTDLDSLPQEKKDEALRRFKIRRKIDMAHAGREQPNLDTATRLLQIIKEEPDAPETEEARRYFYGYGVTREELDGLTPDKLKATFGERMKKIASARRRMDHARSLVGQKRFADAALEFQKILRDYPDIPQLGEARNLLRDWGLQEIEITDDNKDEINDRIAESFQRRAALQRVEGLIRTKKYFEAAKILQSFVAEFPDAPEAREAQEMLGRWNIWDAQLEDADREEVNRVAAQAEAARRAMERAEMLEGAAKIKKALEAYQEISRKYPDTQIATEAERRLLSFGIVAGEDEITDEAVASATKRRAAREKFERAHFSIRNGRYLEAIKSFQEIAKADPNIPEAREAERILRGCGAWGVEVNDQNKDEIIAVLKEMMDR